ncbi:MAG: PQQ-binding-like beta-propeller repeat protein, partial [Armatimonadetes bacterium]|nr:PQQ-binding-like beta-propeller repeat protein [Armatimonadota bacterium]
MPKTSPSLGLLMGLRTAGLSSSVALAAVAVLIVVVGLTVAHAVGGLQGKGEWTTYMFDASRSGCTSAAVKAPLAERWVFVPKAAPAPAWPDPPSSPVEGVLEIPKMKFDDCYPVVVDHGQVFFGTSDNKVYCLDAATGKVRWKMFTDGPVRMAPVLYRGRVFFGSDDGCVYCVRASNGALLWRKHLAPMERRLLARGKMVSMWPVRTGMIIYDDTLYCGAGVFPGERIYIAALRPSDGAVIWMNDTLGEKDAGRGGLSPQGYLLASKDFLFVPSGRALPACFDRATGRQLYQKGYSRWTYGPLGGSWALLADGHLFAGGMPIYGYDAKSGNIGFAVFPTAKQLVVTPRLVYALTPQGILALDRQTYPKLSKERRALSQRRTALMKQKPKDLAERLKKLKAEEERNKAALAACQKWTYEDPNLECLIVAGDTVVAGGKGEVVLLDRHSGKKLTSLTIGGRARSLAVAEDKLFVSSDTGQIYCFEPGAPAAAAATADRRIVREPVKDPFEGKVSALDRAAAEAIVQQTGVTEGYCLVLGCPTGGLAYELAKKTKLHIYVVDPSRQRVEAARRAFDAAGLYGTRVCVDWFDYDAIPYSDYFANLIVSEEALHSGRVSLSASEAYRMLKPCGGIMLIGAPRGGPGKLTATALRRWAAQGKLRGAEIVRKQGQWLKLARGPLPGAGAWTHQYAEPGNTACSDDIGVHAPLGVLWYGDPGPATVPSRHARNVAPLSIGGRVYLQGINRIMCFDAFNGQMYWDREIQGAFRVGSSGEASNIACNEDSLFVSVGTKCLRLDGKTGKTLATFDCPVLHGGNPARWAYVAVVGNLLYGSAASRSRYSDTLFAYDIPSGKLVWKHQGKSIPDVTISISDGRVFFVDERATAEDRQVALKQYAARLKAEKGLSGDALQKALAKRDVRIAVALDAKTGTKIWEKPLDLTDCGGNLLITMASKGALVFSGAYGDGHYWNQFLGGEFARRRVLVVSAKDGSIKWSKAVGCRIRPLIVGDVLYAEPWAFNLQTGEQLMRTHPLTGRKVPWEMERPGHHCGCISASPKGLYFRSWSYGYYDLVKDEGTKHFGGIRPGCWINMIPANGLLVVPEASSGCVCLVSLQCTTVFQPRPQERRWGLFASPGDKLPVNHLYVNLGAPGDRKDSQGKLWLGYPRPWGRLRLALNFAADLLPGGGYYSEATDQCKVAGTRENWLFASGCAGLSSCDIPLRGEADGQAQYTVRLGFVAPDTDR